MKTKIILKPKKGDESYVQLEGQEMFSGVYTKVKKPQGIHFTGEGFLRLVQGDNVMITVTKNMSITELRKTRDRIS